MFTECIAKAMTLIGFYAIYTTCRLRCRYLFLCAKTILAFALPISGFVFSFLAIYAII